MASLLNVKAFMLELFGHFGSEQNMELDYCAFTDLAENHHLIRWEDYDPKKHGEECYDAEEGDRIWLANDIEPFLCGHCGDPLAVRKIEGKHFASCDCLAPPIITIVAKDPGESEVAG